MKRSPGHASVEEHPKGSGLYRVRTRIGGKLKTLGSRLTKGAATELANAQASVRNAHEVREGVTVAQFGVAFLARRADQGVRAVKKDSYCWNKHVRDSAIGKLAVASLLRSDVVQWRDTLVGAHRTKKKALNLFRVALDEAVERGLLDANPAREVKLHKSAAASNTDDLDGILTPPEQRALLDAVPLRDRPAVAFALFTGLRLSEQWRLDWTDLDAEAVIVSKSVGGEGPKSGKVREVPLLPEAKLAVTVQRAFGRKSPAVFPGARGARRQDTKSPLTWPKWVKAAGINRHVTWHDLRYTCATALLAGWWGRKWSLDEVCKMLGHSSIAVTERYARKLNETLRLAIAATPGPQFPMFPRGNGLELTMGNDRSSSAFVKRRSPVRNWESAPVLTDRNGEHAGNSAGPRTRTSATEPKTVDSRDSVRSKELLEIEFPLGIRKVDPVLDARRETPDMSGDRCPYCAGYHEGYPCRSRPIDDGVGASFGWLGPLPPPSEPGGFGWLRDEWGGR